MVLKPAVMQGNEQRTAESSPAAIRRLRNQFNFSERGAQTPYLAPRDFAVQLETPATAEALGECSSSEIFDAYMSDMQQQQQQEVPACKWILLHTNAVHFLPQAS